MVIVQQIYMAIMHLTTVLIFQPLLLSSNHCFFSSKLTHHTFQLSFFVQASRTTCYAFKKPGPVLLLCLLPQIMLGLFFASFGTCTSSNFTKLAFVFCINAFQSLSLGLKMNLRFHMQYYLSGSHETSIVNAVLY